MKTWKWRILLPLILVTMLVGGKFVLWNFPISSGKRVGNLTKISKKGKFWFTKTWEGTIDEGSGDILTSAFSVRDEALAQELYEYEGRKVILYYNEYILGWPRETHYDILSWKPKADIEFGEQEVTALSGGSDKLVDYVGKTLFCTLLGTLYQDQELYKRVKDFIKEKNLYLYNQYGKCNE